MKVYFREILKIKNDSTNYNCYSCFIWNAICNICAFGAHALKNILSKDQLHSFETGVRYQMYHALVLLALGFNSNKISSVIYWCFTIGIILFSFSIYGLILSDVKGKKLRFLGPITPIGGLLLVIG